MPTDLITAYKIVEVVDNDLRTLFHGWNGSRTMPQKQWLKAQEKLVKDGTQNTSYMSGWHVFLFLDDCAEYKDKFTDRPELLRCVRCKVRDVRPKEHSPSPVMLAKWIWFEGITDHAS